MNTEKDPNPMQTAYRHGVRQWRTPRRELRRDRAPRGRFAPDPRPLLLQPQATPVVDLRNSTLDWPGFWRVVHSCLAKAGYRRSTVVVYRQVLRSLRQNLEQRYGAGSPLARPACVSGADAGAYFRGLTDRHSSSSWLSVNISVMRTVFDKLGGLSLTTHMPTPKRPRRLAHTVTSNDVGRLIEAAPTIRDRLLIGLLYGCGLKAGEACRLRWEDVGLEAGQLTVRFAGNTRRRLVSVPEALRPVLAAGVSRCDPQAYILAGAKGELTALSTRTAQRIVRRAAMQAAIGKPVCAMTLRHAYGVESLRAGANVAQVQESLGHLSIKTTMQYQHHILPDDVVSPADRLPAPTSEVTLRSESIPSATPPSVSLPVPPIAVAGLSVPFAHVADGAREFYAWLKARLTSRFLAQRAAFQYSG